MKSPKDIAGNLPNNPGIYKMLDQEGEILYIGKAKNLKKRTSSYFNKTLKDLKTQALVKHIKNIDFIVTHTEQEALVLENQLIKHHQPRYNIQLKDDKSYPYIKITDENFPRLLITRFKRKDNAQYFGPFPAMGSSRKLTQTLLDIFPLRDCKQKISLTKLEPKCLQVDIGKCLGPCIYKNILSSYKDTVQDLALFLSGKNKSLIKKLEQNMKLKSEALDFEGAAKLRDDLLRLKDLHLKQMVCLENTLNIDIIVAVQANETLYFLYQKITEGKLISQRGLFLDKANTVNPSELLLEALNTLFESSSLPKELLCNPLIQKYSQNFQEVYDDIIFKVPQRGVKVELLEKANLNAKIAIQKVNRPKYDTNLMENLAEVLQSTQEITLIFGFDISHFYAQDIVASAVCFKEGSVYKDGYRHFGIKSLTHQKSDDPKAIYEAVLRRLNLAQKENMIPDLLLIDGGKTQLNAAQQALQDSELGHRPIIVISLAKKEELIYQVGKKKALRLKAQDPVLKLLQNIRDESHRFANRLQKIKRNKRAFS